MGMTVNTMASNELQKNFMRYNAGEVGKKTVSDDAAGAAIAEKLSAEISGLEQGVNNTSNMDNLVKTADGALGGIADGLARVQELATQANSGILNDDDRAILQNEAEQILQSISDTVNNTEYNNKKLLDGSFKDANTASDADGGGMKVSISNMSLEALGLNDFNVSDPTALDSISSAIDAVASQRSDLGSISNTFAHTIASNDITGLNLASARSGLADVDMAKQITDSKKEEVLDQYRLNMQTADIQQRQRIMGTLLP